MLVKAEHLQNQPKTNPCYKITASLLNAWQYVLDSVEMVKEAEYDKICLEDKKELKYEQELKKFIDTLKRVPFAPTEAMVRGQEYEASVYRGEDSTFSPIVENGAFQVSIRKNVVIDGVQIQLHGILDVLKANHIYDIKRTGWYKYPKFKTSHQHSMYFELVPEAMDFTYLICDNDDMHYTEYIERCNSEDIKKVISEFLEWLKMNNLYEIYTQNWAINY